MIESFFDTKKCQKYSGSENILKQISKFVYNFAFVR